MVNGKNPLSQEDFALAQISILSNKPVILLINKSESRIHLFPFFAQKLELGNGVLVSSAHQIGFDQIYRLMKRKLNLELYIFFNNRIS